MFFRKKNPFSDAQLPSGERVYAIGDIHGEAKLLEKLLGKIADEQNSRDVMTVTLVILGDFIDRGGGSAHILDSLAQANKEHFVVIKGNHEACLVASYQGDETAMDFWRQFGGRATMVGLGISDSDIDRLDSRELIECLRSSIDKEVIYWVDSLPTSWSMGDYFFAHAGVRPGVDLDKQNPKDLMWIRQPFLGSRRDHGKIIVHGHTIEAGMPRLGGNRIGIDTGGHENRCLTALGLEGNEQWIIQANDHIESE